jgi:hypothetical protein
MLVIKAILLVEKSIYLMYTVSGIMLNIVYSVVFAYISMCIHTCVYVDSFLSFFLFFFVKDQIQGLPHASQVKVSN